MRGKLIVIEGTDCSGKETQTKLLIEKLKNKSIQVDNFSFPNYNSPTGKIIGGSYLGKPTIGESYFKEGAANVDPKVASLYYAADRKYNIDKINFLLENGGNIILDRYIYSNMAHQGCKFNKGNERKAMYEWLENLEFDLLKLPKPDIGIFLHMPYENAKELKKNREEVPDGHEKDADHLIKAEMAYIELAERYNLKTIECAEGTRIKTPMEINEEVFEYVYNQLMNIKN